MPKKWNKPIESLNSSYKIWGNIWGNILENPADISRKCPNSGYIYYYLNYYLKEMDGLKRKMEKMVRDLDEKKSEIFACKQQMQVNSQTCST